MKNAEVRMKNEANDKVAAESSSDPRKQKPEHGADSQLHCYNAVPWRLGDLFGENKEPEPPKPEK
jgi:hypothetical protein